MQSPLQLLPQPDYGRGKEHDLVIPKSHSFEDSEGEGRFQATVSLSFAKSHLITDVAIQVPYVLQGEARRLPRRTPQMDGVERFKRAYGRCLIHDV